MLAGSSGKIDGTSLALPPAHFRIGR
jgi:hypothetical protein